MSKISVITVNYNTADLISRCIESVLKQKDVDFEMIVVDNASQDQSVRVLAQYEDQVKIILNRDNLGFGRANNQAAHLATGDYLFLLNPDAYLDDDKALHKIVSFMHRNDHFGLVGTQIVGLGQAEETKVKYFHTGERRINFPYKELPGKIAWVIGASMVIPKRIYDKVKGFDEDYFLYGEDEDICLRIRKAGYAIGYYPDVKVMHVDGASERKNSWYDITTKKQKALFQFYKKHYSDTAIRTLLKKDLHRAQRRVTINKIRLTLKLKPSQRKYDVYRAIYDCSKAFLQELAMKKS